MQRAGTQAVPRKVELVRGLAIMLVAELQTPPAVGKQEGVTEAAAQVGLNVLSDNLHRRQEISSRLILAIRRPLLLNSLI